MKSSVPKEPEDPQTVLFIHPTTLRKSFEENRRHPGIAAMTTTFFGGIPFDQDVTGIGRKESEGDRKMVETVSVRGKFFVGLLIKGG